MRSLTVDECRLALLLLVLVLALWVDLRSRRIPNSLVLFGMAAALLLAVWEWRAEALLTFAAGAGVGFLGFLPFYLLRWVGAGDVKLMAVIGGFVGFPDVLWVVLFALLSGGVVAWLLIAYVEKLLPSPYRVLAIAWSAAIQGGKAMKTGMAGQGVTSSGYPSVPYSLALAAGTVAWKVLVFNAG